MAWQRISPELTVKGFKKCCLSSAVDGTDDGMLWNDSEDEGDTYIHTFHRSLRLSQDNRMWHTS